jgi:xylulokinase
MRFLGIDLGTSALKAVLVDETQAVIAEASVPLTTSRPRPGWSEQDPAAWWSALAAALATLRAARPDALRAMRALGLSGQMHGAVALDEQDAPVRPAILWNDSRSTMECRALQAAVPEVAEIAGIAPMPGFTAPKALWLRRHEPEAFARIRRFVLPKDFLRLRLTGEFATDMSDAAGTLWLDQGRRAWSDALLEASGLHRGQVPRLVEGTELAGNVRPPLLAELGIDGPVIVAGGAGDVAAAAIGIGAVENGDASLSLGTSAQLVVTEGAFRPQPDSPIHAFAHALPGRWFRMAAMLDGASCLEWAARLLAEDNIAALLTRVEAAYEGPSRVMFLPHLSGERTPHHDAPAHGVLAGLDASVSKIDLAQAVLEGVAFSFLEARQMIERAGSPLASVSAVGGGARSRFWMQLVANVLGLPVTRYVGGDKGPAFGAARLARLALTGERPTDVCVKPPIEDVLRPDPVLHNAYRDRCAGYSDLHSALRLHFAGQAPNGLH